MPTLKRAEDGHWFIRAFVFAAGHLGTWQVAEEGLEWLHRRGYEEGEIPTELFNELCERNWAYTGGSGFGDQVSVEFLPAKGAEKQLKIGITATVDGWILEVLIPELPAEIFAELLQKGKRSELGKCSLRMEGERESLPISRLWPGKGGARWPVDPKQGSYRLTLMGGWPSISSVQYLTNPIDGLDPAGTLLFGSSKLGVRLPRGMSLPPDDSYYLVLGKKQSEHLRIPAGITSRAIGSNSGWHAWEVQLDSHADETAKRWFARFGATIDEPKLQLHIVSPPPKAILVTGLPLFEAGEQMVLAAEGTTSKVQLDQFGVVVLREGVREHEVRSLRNARPGESVYWSFAAARPGTYQVRALKGRVTPLTFAVRPRVEAEKAESQNLLPRALSVKVGEHSYRAFGGQPTEERIDVWVRKSEMPTVQIDCAAPLEVTWTIQGTTERRSLESAEAGEFLTREIARALTERKAIVFDADAAGFGRLSLRIAAEELRISEGLRTIAPMALYRARWLAGTIAALRRGDVREVGVDRETRAALADLAGHPGCGGLGNLTTVPVEVAPHVRALTGNLALATMRGATPRSSVGRV
jgi:hypothetical protein